MKVDYQGTYLRLKIIGLCRGGRILLFCCLDKGMKKIMTKQASDHVNNVENIAPELKDVRNVKKKEKILGCIKNVPQLWPGKVSGHLLVCMQQNTFRRLDILR